MIFEHICNLGLDLLALFRVGLVLAEQQLDLGAVSGHLGLLVAVRVQIVVVLTKTVDALHAPSARQNVVLVARCLERFEWRGGGRVTL